MNLKPSAVITLRDNLNYYVYYVEVFWTGTKLDRPTTVGIVVEKKSLAERLKKAVDAGAVHTNPQVVRDCDGKSYVQANCKVIGRTLNADLRRLGF